VKAGVGLAPPPELPHGHQRCTAREVRELRRPVAFLLWIGGQGNEKARFIGTIGDFDIWIYNDVYTDDLGNTVPMLPTNTVIVGSPVNVEGTRCYGVIQDEKAAYRAQRYFSKSWLEEDPAVRWLLLQSAPLVVPYRPNACFCATVN